MGWILYLARELLAKACWDIHTGPCGGPDAARWRAIKEGISPSTILNIKSVTGEISSCQTGEVRTSKLRNSSLTTWPTPLVPPTILLPRHIWYTELSASIGRSDGGISSQALLRCSADRQSDLSTTGREWQLFAKQMKPGRGAANIDVRTSSDPAENALFAMEQQTPVPWSQIFEAMRKSSHYSDVHNQRE